MKEISFMISEEDLDRLFTLKAEAGKAHLTANEYAKELLEDMLYTFHPQKDTGNTGGVSVFPR